MNCIYKILTEILLGVVDSVKGTTVVFYLDYEASKNSGRLESAPATKESLSSPVAGHHLRRSSGTTKSTMRNQDNASGKKEPTLLSRVLRCVMMNGLACLLSSMFFHGVIMPGLSLLLSCMSTNSDNQKNVWRWMEPTLSMLFDGLWLIPVYCLSKFVNSFWFQDIADFAFRSRKGRPLKSFRLSEGIADFLSNCLVQFLFLMQNTIMKRLLSPFPYVGYVIYIVNVSLLFSLYSFEYKWLNICWMLPTRLHYIETNWPYFLGFGLPLAVLSEMPSSIITSGCVFSILFPLFILSAIEAKPKVSEGAIPIKVFSLSVGASNVLVRRFPSKKPDIPTRIEANPNTSTGGKMIGREVTPPLSSGASTPSLNYQLSQQQRIRQYNQQHRQHGRCSPSSVATASTAGTNTGLTLIQQQQQALFNRNFRR